MLGLFGKKKEQPPQRWDLRVVKENGSFTPEIYLEFPGASAEYADWYPLWVDGSAGVYIDWHRQWSKQRPWFATSALAKQFAQQNLERLRIAREDRDREGAGEVEFTADNFSKRLDVSGLDDFSPDEFPDNF